MRVVAFMVGFVKCSHSLQLLTTSKRNDVAQGWDRFLRCWRMQYRNTTKGRKGAPAVGDGIRKVVAPLPPE